MADTYDTIDESRLSTGNGRTLPRRQINIIHPGYGDPIFDVLISFEAFDDGGTGIGYNTAHTACAILADNRDGYFSKDVKGKDKAEPPDGILRDKRYYFCLSSSKDPSTDKYPIVPRFKDWRFPHDDLPPAWKRLGEEQDTAQGQGLRTGNNRCSLTNCGDVVEQAHLVPSQQRDWFNGNRMHIAHASDSYVRTSYFSTNHIDAPTNLLPLRCDIHKIFDERHFTFVPKTVIPRPTEKLEGDELQEAQGDDELPANEAVENSQPLGSSSKLPIRQNPRGLQDEPQTKTNTDSQPIHVVGHVFNSTPSGDLPPRFHNRALCMLPSAISAELLFARFAWTIFSPSIFKDFLCSDKERHIKIWNKDEKEQETEWASAERCLSIWNASRARSESPKKRSKQAEEATENESDLRKDNDGNWGKTLCCVESDVDSAYGDHSQHSHMSDDADEPPRGRRRKRDWEEDVPDISRVYDSAGAKRTKMGGRTKL
ncbi:hypothetical protein FOXB_16832 [Fusarium oxysporum f. sp. conglutinans Fo5176]|uniref:HNH nuclease domain-containing protein n=1 Tax=Fusarium oxysporum (strain Fo5176) TaxID=660025 RepID=F9GDU8_FUSOF|nr:hypothetical protein FOXB_16832 [Fusarium oxysporum f. sp. conglutinans Fo5176]